MNTEININIEEYEKFVMGPLTSYLASCIESEECSFEVAAAVLDNSISLLRSMEEDNVIDIN